MSRTETSPHQQTWLRPAATSPLSRPPSRAGDTPTGFSSAFTRSPVRAVCSDLRPVPRAPPGSAAQFHRAGADPSGRDRARASELEHSALDDAPGKRFWSSDDLSETAPRDPLSPAQGVVEVVDGVETLTVHILSERFENALRWPCGSGSGGIGRTRWRWRRSRCPARRRSST